MVPYNKYTVTDAINDGYGLANVTNIDNNRKFTIDDYFDNSKCQILAIAAGTGSGKNYWVTHTLAKDKRILLLTSRKIKVMQDSNGLSKTSKIKFDNSFENLGHNICTYSKLAEHINKNTKFKAKKDNMIWLENFVSNFDYIIFDETHALACDATFQDDVFTVFMFMYYALQHSNVRFILMSATFDPVKEIINSIACDISENNDNSQNKNKDINTSLSYLSLLNQCEYVVPQKIVLTNKKDKKDIIKKCVQSDRHYIHFFNKIFLNDSDEDDDETLGDKLEQEYLYLTNELDVPPQDIAVILSDNALAKWETKYPRARISNKDQVLSYQEIKEKIANESSIPPNISYILCSATMNEGISIENTKDRFTVMITEARYKPYIIQQIGRLRDGVQECHIIFNSKQHINSNDYVDNVLFGKHEDDKFDILSEINRRYALIKERKYKSEFILRLIPNYKGSNEELNSTSSYLSYNPFNNQFYTNSLRRTMKQYLKEQELTIKNKSSVSDHKINEKNLNAMKKWRDDILSFCKEYNIDCDDNAIGKEINALDKTPQVKEVVTFLKSKDGKVLSKDEKAQLIALCRDAELGNTAAKIVNSLKAYKYNFEVISSRTKSQRQHTYKYIGEL